MYNENVLIERINKLSIPQKEAIFHLVTSMVEEEYFTDKEIRQIKAAQKEKGIPDCKIDWKSIGK